MTKLNISKKNLVIGGAILLGLLIWFAVSVNAKQPEVDEVKKVFVCKYVGTPGDDERLQTGQNPINVSINSIQNYPGVGQYFNDAHGRSYVLAEDTGQPEPDVSECPKPDNPPEEEPEEPKEEEETPDVGSPAESKVKSNPIVPVQDTTQTTKGLQ